jgi:hypothetical protein
VIHPFQVQRFRSQESTKVRDFEATTTSLYPIMPRRAKRIKEPLIQETEMHNPAFCLLTKVPMEILELIIGQLSILDLPKVMSLSKVIQVTLIV